VAFTRRSITKDFSPSSLTIASMVRISESSEKSLRFRYQGEHTMSNGNKTLYERLLPRNELKTAL
jgi:hypothetical protein